MVDAPLCVSRSERYLTLAPANCKSTSEGEAAVRPLHLPTGCWDRLESDLGAHRQRVESGADVAGVGGADLFDDIAVDVVEHEADVAIDVPVEARRIDGLPAARHPGCGCELVVEIDLRDASRDLPCAPATAGQRERIDRHDAVIGGR